MTSRIVFYIPRKTCLRVMAPVIAHLLRDHADSVEVRAAFPAWLISKTDLQPSADDVTRLFGQAVRCCPLNHPAELETVLREADTLVTQLPDMADMPRSSVHQLRARSRAWGVRWIALPFLFSQDHFVLLDPDFVLETWDVICTAGSASIRYVETATQSWTTAKREAVLNRLVVTGYPGLDGIAHLAAPADIRRRYQLPADRPVICLGTAYGFYPRNNSSACARGLQSRFLGVTEWSLGGVVSRMVSYRYPWIVPYPEYLSAIRRLADAHGAVVVAKTRAKHHDPPYLEAFVDRIVGDASFFPTSALELLSVSCFYFGFASAMAVEAMALGIYALTALAHPLEEVANPAWTPWLAHFFQSPGGVWNVPGVSESINGVGFGAHADVRRLENFPLHRAVDDARRRRFLADHFDWPAPASARVADVLLHAPVSSSRRTSAC